VVTGKHLSQRVELTVFKGVIKFSGQWTVVFKYYPCLQLLNISKVNRLI
jgi:hypothetical protein